MVYDELPETINSPFTGDVLFLEEKSETLCLADISDTCTEYVADVACYYNEKETMYIQLN